MMKKCIFLTILFVCINFYNAYNQTLIETQDIEKLKSEILKQDKLNQKVDLFNQLADHYSTAQLDSVFKYTNKAIDLATELDYKTGIAKAWVNLTVYYYYTSQIDSVYHYSSKAIKLYETLKDNVGLAGARNDFGYVLERFGKFQEAEEQYLLAIELFRTEEEEDKLANSFINLGNLYSNAGNYEGAFDQFNEADKILNHTPNQKNLANLFNGKAVTFDRKGVLDSAFIYLNRAEKIYIELDFQANLFVVHNNRGTLFRKKGNISEALKNYNVALTIAENQKNNRHISIASNNLGIVYLDIEEYDKALYYFEKAASISKSIDLLTHNITQLNIALILKQDDKQLDKVKAILEQSLIFFEEQGMESIKVPTYNLLGDVYQSQKKYNKANEYFSKARGLAIEFEDQFAEAHSLNGLAEIALEKGDYEQAVLLAKINLEISQPINNFEAEAYANQILSEAFKQQKRYDLAVAHYEDYIAASNQIINEEKATAIGRIEAENEFRIEKELLELETINNQLEKDKEKANLQKKLYSFVGGFIFILVILIYFIKKQQNLSKSKKKLKNIHIQIKQTQKELLAINKEKNQLFNIVAKNLQGPLNKLFSRFKEYQKDEHKASLKKEIGTILHKTLFITNNLLNWASQEMRELKENQQKITISELINTVVKAVEEEVKQKNIQIIFDLNNSPNRYIKRQPLNIILINLLYFIIQESKKAERISITQDLNEDSDIHLLITFSENATIEKQLTGFLNDKHDDIQKDSFSLELTKKIIRENNIKLELQKIKTKLILSIKVPAK